MTDTDLRVFAVMGERSDGDLRTDIASPYILRKKVAQNDL
jgi:hypothetical protein